MAKAAKHFKPEGTHSITAHLVVADAVKAMEFYKKAFGAEELFRMPGPGGKLMHAEVRIGDSPVYLCDEFPDWGCRGPLSIGGSAVTVHLYVPDADAVYQKAISAGATATMPICDAPWGDRYGKLVDPFGHHWSIATHKEELTPEEIGERMAKMGEQCG